MPDTVESQLEVLRKIGFKEVDCYFKYGGCVYGALGKNPK